MKALKPVGVNLLQANGAGAGQSVPHLHIHIMPRRPSDDVSLNWEHKPGDMAAIEAVYEKLKAALYLDRWPTGERSIRRRPERGWPECSATASAAPAGREPLALVLAELVAHVVDDRADARALVGLLVAHQPDVAHDPEVDRRRDQVRRLGDVVGEHRDAVADPHRLDGGVGGVGAQHDEGLRSTTSLHGFIAGRLCKVVWSTMWCSRRSSSFCGRPYCSM